MKKQNPLYVVKKDYVEEAQGMMDLLIKKLNLTPVIDILTSILKMLLDSVRTYAGLAVVIEFFDHIVERVILFKQFSI